MTPIMLCLAFKITLLSLLCMLWLCRGAEAVYDTYYALPRFQDNTTVFKISMLWLCRGAEAVYDTYYALPRFQDNTTVFKISIHTDTSQKSLFTNTPSHSLRSLFITFFTLLSHINLASFSHLLFGNCPPIGSIPLMIEIPIRGHFSISAQKK